MSLSFVCGGDVMINRPDPRSILRNVKRFLIDADIGCVNLEGPACDVGAPHPDMFGVGRKHIRSAPTAVGALAEAGVDVVSLANNHTMNYGVEGLDQTIALLEQANIAHAGAGHNLAEARRPAVLDVNGIRVSLLSYTSVCVPSFAAGRDSPGAATVRIDTTYEETPRLFMQPGAPMRIRTTAKPEDVRVLEEDIRSAKANSDVVIVGWHWGISERWGKLAEYQPALAHAAIDAGADAILGHHAHMLLGVEFYRNRPIFYSMGNFAFDQDHEYFRRESLVAQLTITKDGVAAVRVVPLLINDEHEPVVARAGRETQKVAWFLEYLCEGLQTDLEVNDDHIALLPRSAR